MTSIYDYFVHVEEHLQAPHGLPHEASIDVALRNADAVVFACAAGIPSDATACLLMTTVKETPRG